MRKFTLSDSTPTEAIPVPGGLITVFIGSTAHQDFGGGNVTIQVSPDSSEWFDLDDSETTVRSVVNVWCDAPYYRIVANAAAVDLDVWASGRT